MSIGQPEFALNPEPRCPCAVLIDTSGSMYGEPVEEVNKGINILLDELMQDHLARLRVELGIFTFGGRAKMVQDFTTIENISPPQFSADGGTPMGEAINMALDSLEDRKLEYRSNGIQMYRPWVFLITDGAPTDSWRDAAQRIQEGEDSKKFSFYAVGVEGADMRTLTEIAPVNRPPMMLQGLAFPAMFKWLSVSMMKISYSQGANEQVTLDPVNGWAQTTS